MSLFLATRVTTSGPWKQCSSISRPSSWMEGKEVDICMLELRLMRDDPAGLLKPGVPAEANGAPGQWSPSSFDPASGSRGQASHLKMFTVRNVFADILSLFQSITLLLHYYDTSCHTLVKPISMMTYGPSIAAFWLSLYQHLAKGRPVTSTFARIVDWYTWNCKSQNAVKCKKWT